MASAAESRLVSLFAYNPTLSTKEGTEHLKILFYHPDEESLNRKVRNIGLCEALVNFTKRFNPTKVCEAVHTQRLRQVFLEAEPNIWMVMTVSIPWASVINNGEKKVEYYDAHVQDFVLQAALSKAYFTFKLFNGSFGSIRRAYGVEGLRSRMEKFFSRYVQQLDVSSLDLFDVFQGIQFLPLDKYIYLKIHCFINQVETTFRNIQRTVVFYNDQLVWSGLEQDDIKIFYQHLHSWLFPTQQEYSTSTSVTASVSPGPHHTHTQAGSAHPTQSIMHSVKPSSSSSPSSTASLTTSIPRTGTFLIGHPGSSAGSSFTLGGANEVGRSPWVYITVDGQLQSFRLYVYSAGNVTMCFFVKSDKAASPQHDFCKKLGTYLGPRLAQISREITDFTSKNKTSQGNDQQYKFIYFNQMNLAVKSPLLSRKPAHLTVSLDAMRLLAEINLEYDNIEEGETIARTFADYWVVCRKSGHRSFFVVLNQKSANFAEINDEVRRLCQKEFTNIFFFD